MVRIKYLNIREYQNILTVIVSNLSWITGISASIFYVSSVLLRVCCRKFFDFLYTSKMLKLCFVHAINLSNSFRCIYWYCFKLFFFLLFRVLIVVLYFFCEKRMLNLNNSIKMTFCNIHFGWLCICVQYNRYQTIFFFLI